MSRLWQIVSFYYFALPSDLTLSFLCELFLLLLDLLFGLSVFASLFHSTPVFFPRYRYSKKTSLFTHHKTHPEHCVHCGENRGSSVENIYEHNLKHINIRPFICKLCGDSFLRNQQFVEHEKSHDKPPEEPAIKESKYKCKACQSSYSNWWVQPGLSDTSCSDFMFIFRKLFYKHQQESGHFNEKFLCEICGSEFHSNFLLSQHIRRLHKRTGSYDGHKSVQSWIFIFSSF